MIRESTHSIQRQYIGSTPHSTDVATAVISPILYSLVSLPEVFIFRSFLSCFSYIESILRHTQLSYHQRTKKASSCLLLEQSAEKAASSVSARTEK